MREKVQIKFVPNNPNNGNRRIHGDAVVKVLVSTRGEVVSAKFVDGNPVFKEIAEDAARRWRFEPMIVDEMPIIVESQLTFHFN